MINSEETWGKLTEILARAKSFGLTTEQQEIAQFFLGVILIAEEERERRHAEVLATIRDLKS